MKVNGHTLSICHLLKKKKKGGGGGGVRERGRWVGEGGAGGGERQLLQKGLLYFDPITTHTPIIANSQAI